MFSSSEPETDRSRSKTAPSENYVKLRKPRRIEKVGIYINLKICYGDAAIREIGRIRAFENKPA